MLAWVGCAGCWQHLQRLCSRCTSWGPALGCPGAPSTLRVVGLCWHLLTPWHPHRDALGSLLLPQLSSSDVERRGVPSPPAEFSCGWTAWTWPLLAEAPGSASPCSAVTSLTNPWLGWQCFLMLQCSTDNVSTLCFVLEERQPCCACALLRVGRVWAKPGCSVPVAGTHSLSEGPGLHVPGPGAARTESACSAAPSRAGLGRQSHCLTGQNGWYRAGADVVPAAGGQTVSHLAQSVSAELACQKSEWTGVG